MTAYFDENVFDSNWFDTGVPVVGGSAIGGKDLTYFPPLLSYEKISLSFIIQIRVVAVLRRTILVSLSCYNELREEFKAVVSIWSNLENTYGGFIKVINRVSESYKGKISKGVVIKIKKSIRGVRESVLDLFDILDI